MKKKLLLSAALIFTFYFSKAQWQVINSGLTSTEVKSFIVNGSTMYAGTFGGGIFKSTNNGANWSSTNNGLSPKDITAFIVNGSKLFAGNDSAGVFVSSDNGATWASASSGLNNNKINCFAANGSYLFAGSSGGGVFRSSDNGNNWSNAGDVGLTDTLVNALFVNGGNLFAGTQGHGVFLSTDNGANWTAVSNGLTNKFISSFVKIGSNLFAGTQFGGVFLSTDNGSNWNSVNNGLTNLNVSSLALSNNNLFAGTTGHGVFLSTDDGANWNAINMGLTNMFVNTLYADGGNLYAGTESPGLFVASICALKNGSTPPICMVTVDSLSQHNIITWEKTTPSGVDSFIVYREITTNDYRRIAALPNSALSEFVDTVKTKYFPFSGDPNAGSYRYKIQIRDTCGNYSPMSPYHNTIFINRTGGTFSWNQYAIEGETTPIPELSSYMLLRDDSSTGNWKVILGVASTQTTMSDPDFAKYPNGNWRIETSWSLSCHATAKEEQSFSVSRSNQLSAVNTGIAKEGAAKGRVTTYPNPFSQETTVSLELKTNSNVELLLYNSLGKLVSTIENKHLPIGNYIYKIQENTKGVYFLRTQIDGVSSTQRLIQVE